MLKNHSSDSHRKTGGGPETHPGQEPYRIPSGVEISGTLKFRDAIVVDGNIDGEIHSERSITISEHAIVKAEICSPRVLVEGCVEGDIHASESLELTGNAEVTGNVRAGSLDMKDGAVLMGTSTIGSSCQADAFGRNASLRKWKLTVV